MGEHATVEGRRRDVDARGPQVGHQDVAGIAPERELSWRTAARARPDLALDHEPSFEQLTHTLGHDAPAEARVVDQLRARP